VSNKTVHYHGRYLAIHERDGWEYTSRTNASGVAIIVPVTSADELVLVEQFRIPVNRRVIELPAGLAGDSGNPDEDMAEAARRELYEETGFQAGSMTLLLVCPSTSGLADEIVSFYLARDLERTGPGGGDASEDIKVHLVDLERIDAWLDEKTNSGYYLDPKIYTALYWLKGGTVPGISGPAATG
jgi:ADP-ribose pyrophosphatase